MKSILVALALISSSTFAIAPDATEVLTSIIPVGEYTGAYNGQDCSVSVENSANGIVVRATKRGLIRMREVTRGSVYYAPRMGEFLSTQKFSTNFGSRENILRTTPVSETQQYIVVADVAIGARDIQELKVECVINL